MSDVNKAVKILLQLQLQLQLQQCNTPPENTSKKSEQSQKKRPKNTSKKSEQSQKKRPKKRLKKAIPDGHVYGEFYIKADGTTRYYPGIKEGEHVSYPDGDVIQISEEDEGMMTREKYVKKAWDEKKVGDKIMVFYSRNQKKAWCWPVTIIQINDIFITVQEKKTKTTWPITRKGWEEQFYLSWWGE